MAEGGELKAHERTYTGFLSLFRYGAIVVAIVAVIVILLISR